MAKEQQQPRNLLELPLEIRRKIYGYVFEPRWGNKSVEEMPARPSWEGYISGSEPLDIPNENFKVTVETSVLRVCHQILLEARDVLYTELQLVKYSIEEEVPNGCYPGMNFPYIAFGAKAEAFEKYILNFRATCTKPKSVARSNSQNAFTAVTSAKYLTELTQHCTMLSDRMVVAMRTVYLDIDYNDKYPVSLEPPDLRRELFANLKHDRFYKCSICGIGTKKLRKETELAMYLNMTDPKHIIAYATWQKERGSHFYKLSRYEKSCEAFKNAQIAMLTCSATRAKPNDPPIVPDTVQEAELRYKVTAGVVVSCLKIAQKECNIKCDIKTLAPINMGNNYLGQLQTIARNMPHIWAYQMSERAKWCYLSAALNRIQATIKLWIASDYSSLVTRQETSESFYQNILRDLEGNKSLLVEAKGIVPGDPKIRFELHEHDIMIGKLSSWAED